MRQEPEAKPSWLEGIEGEQLPVLITTDSKVVRVVAGPGSGKTTGLKCRVLRLVSQGVSPGMIFVGTFTRAIAAELVQAIELPVEGRGGEEDPHGTVDVSTLHALALRLLRQHPVALPGRSLRFLLGFEKGAMLYDIGEVVTSLPTQRHREKELKRVCAAWAQGLDLGEAQFMGEMDRWLRRHEGMLIDEVVQLARKALDSGEIPSGLFDEVIIDEYQDLTAAEQQLVERIWSGRGSLVVLGDDDQSIYSFRFNHPRGVTEFRERWAEDQLEDVKIPDNRRCGRVIVDLANAMMAAAGSNKPPMIPKRGENGELSLVYWPSAWHEVRGLAKYMRARSDQRFLVLVPRRFIGYRLKSQLGGDAQTAFHEEVLEEPVVQERFALASLVANPSDRVALRTALGFEAEGVEHAPKRNAAAYASVALGVDALALVNSIASGETAVVGQGSRHLRARAAYLARVVPELRAKERVADIIDAIFDPQITGRVADEEARQRAIHDVEELRRAARIMCERGDNGDLSAVLEQLRYRKIRDVALSVISC